MSIIIPSYRIYDYSNNKVIDNKITQVKGSIKGLPKLSQQQIISKTIPAYSPKQLDDGTIYSFSWNNYDASDDGEFVKEKKIEIGNDSGDWGNVVLYQFHISNDNVAFLNITDNLKMAGKDKIGRPVVNPVLCSVNFTAYHNNGYGVYEVIEDDNNASFGETSFNDISSSSIYNFDQFEKYAIPILSNQKLSDKDKKVSVVAIDAEYSTSTYEGKYWIDFDVFVGFLADAFGDEYYCSYTFNISCPGVVFQGTDSSIINGEGTSSFILDANQCLYNKATFNKKANMIVDQYKNGKEVVELKCSVSDYYDEDGSLAIDSRISGTDKMPIFDIGDVVRPMVLDRYGKEVPMSVKSDGTPKDFTVSSVTVDFDGALWQTIIAREKTV